MTINGKNYILTGNSLLDGGINDQPILARKTYSDFYKDVTQQKLQDFKDNPVHYSADNSLPVSDQSQSITNKIVNDFAPFASALNALSTQLGTTAAESNRLSQQSAREAMQFEQDQAALNREFQLRSQDRAAAYNAEQAATQRHFDEYLLNKSAAYNAAEAQKSRDWQEYMSNTSYQRAMDDMRAAGLNPILAYSQGGANNGSGATASISGGSSGGMASIGTLSGSMGSGRTASMRSDSSAVDLISNITPLMVLGIGSLLSTGLQSLIKLIGVRK